MIVRAIESVFAQTLSVHEIIVVDDGSTDGTASEVKRRFQGVRVVSTKNCGPGHARNVGADCANGDLLFFLDSDDIWHENHVHALLYSHSQGDEACYGVTKNISLFSHESYADQGFFLIPDHWQRFSGWIKRELFRWCFLVPSSFSITRKAYMQSGGFPEDYPGEDWVFFLRLAEQHRFGFTDNIITTRYMHGANLCCNKDLTTEAGLIWGRVCGEMLSSRWVTDEDAIWARSHAELIKQDGYKWKNVQDWYLAAKHRLL